MEQILSSGVKGVLIKSVAQAIQMYSMSCFKLPRGLYQHIDGLLQSIWWGSKEGKRNTCWVAREELTIPEFPGGLVFWDMELFNLALFTRLAWRILEDPMSLSAGVLKSVYYPQRDFLSAELGSSPSRLWRTIMDGKDVQQGLIRRIGTAEQMRRQKFGI